MRDRSKDITVVNPRKATSAVARAAGQAKVIVLAGEDVGRKYAVGDLAIIGRANDSTILIDDDDVSRRHAQILRVDSGDFVLQDLQSRNGTYVNGVPVWDQAPLAFGDKIQIGSRVVLLFTLRDPVEEQILQRQRLEVLGRLGAGIAHDFNNMLGAVLGTLEYLAMQPQDLRLDDPEVVDCLADMRAAAKRAAELTPRLLSFVRTGARKEEAVDVSSMCDEVTLLLRRTFDRSIRIVSEVAPGLEVVGDRVELHQMLMNLCLNARDAMPAGGVLTIGARTATEAEVAAHALHVAEGYLVLRIEDTGVGMDDETRARIFEHFFTTKRPDKGFGLGLATVSEVVRSHGGRVDATSAQGKGTSFVVYLPTGTAEPKRRDPRPTKQMRAALRRDQRVGGAVILLADDEEVVRRVTGRVLKRAGHEVLYAVDGNEAVGVVDGCRPPPDLVILDLDMPNLSGDAAHRALRARFPDLRVVFLTGHADEARERDLIEAGAAVVLRKPCPAAELLGAVERALSGPASNPHGRAHGSDA